MAGLTDTHLHLIQAGVGLVVAVLGLVNVWQGKKIARLRRKYRQALHDLLAFHALEELYCKCLCNFPEPQIHSCSILGCKRSVRLLHRAAQNETPSDLATPQRIKNELARLG